MFIVELEFRHRRIREFLKLGVYNRRYFVFFHMLDLGKKETIIYNP